jgi:hypothetical protein
MVVRKFAIAMGGDGRVVACSRRARSDGLGAMTAARNRFAAQLEDAADRIADVPRHELQVLLRRAALRLRNIDRPPASLDDEYCALIDGMNGADPEGAA